MNSNTDQSQLAAAYERRLPEILAIPDAELGPVHVDVVQSVVTVLGTLPEIRRHRAELSSLPNVDQHLIEGLEDYARAAAEANSRYNTALHGKDALAEDLEAGSSLRDTFRLDGAVLARRGLIDSTAVDSFKNLTGYKNVGSDLVDWATLFLNGWDRIEGKSGLSLEEINAGKALGERLLAGLGEREQGPAVRAENAKIRHQAITLLLKSYDETRRAIAFLRWKEGDAETIAPSLYAGRRKRAVQTSDLADSGTGQTGTPTPSPVETNGNGATHDLPFGIARPAEVTQH